MQEIKGAENLSAAELNYELQNGGRLVVYQYCISVIFITFARNSKVFLVRSDESAVKKGLSYSLLSLLFGLWGIPWGPIRTISAILTNFGGGKDAMDEVAIASNTNFNDW